MDGHRVVVYGQYDVKTVAINSSNKSRLMVVNYTVTEIQQYDIILRALWLYAIDLECNFRSGT